MRSCQLPALNAESCRAIFGISPFSFLSGSKKPNLSGIANTQLSSVLVIISKQSHPVQFMTSNSNPSPDEQQADIDRQIAELLAKGYKREDLWISGSGRVMVDPDAKDLESHNKVFHPDKK
jgi:hypothetical protein